MWFSRDPQILQRRGYSFLLWGLVAVVFGVAVLLWPRLTAEVFVGFFGAAILVIGLALAYGASRLRDVAGRAWLGALAPALAIAVFGALMLIFPGAVATVVLIVMGALAVVVGIGDLASALAISAVARWWWLRALRGALLTGIGVWIVLTPVSGLVALGWVLGLWAIAVGALSVALGTAALRS